MTASHPATTMRPQYDIEGYSPDGHLVLIGEVKAGAGMTEESARLFRRNLIAHGLLPRDVYFLLAFRTTIYLWKPQAAEDTAPDFKAAASSVLKRSLGDLADNESAVGPESMQFAFQHWLSGFTHGVSLPEAGSDADRVLLESGLYPRIKGGEIRQELAA